MDWLARKNNRTNKECLQEGIAQGIGITLFGGPVFIIALVKGWFVFSIFLILCVGIFYGAKALIKNTSLVSGSGRGEFWWLGFFIGFIVVMLCFFPLMALPQ